MRHLHIHGKNKSHGWSDSAIRCLCWERGLDVGPHALLILAVCLAERGGEVGYRPASVGNANFHKGEYVISKECRVSYQR